MRAALAAWVVLAALWIPGNAEARRTCKVNGKRYGNGAHWCQGAVLQYCRNGAVKVRARCVYGCYRLGSVRAYCQCPGGYVSGQRFCHQGKRYVCVRSREAPGGSILGSCPKHHACQAHGQCVKATLTRKIDAYALKELRQSKTVGFAVGVVQNNQLIHLKGYGHKSQKKQVRITTSSVFSWASISKTVTAVAALKMVEGKHLDLSKSPRHYLPYFPRKRFPTTVNHLLANSGGIGHYGHLSGSYKSWRARRKSYPDKLGFLPRRALDIFAGAPMYYRPGSRTVYSTFGFVLAGAVVDSIAKKKYRYKGYEQYVKRHIASLAKMRGLKTSRQWGQVPIRQRMVGHRKDDKGKIVAITQGRFSWCLPGCGFISPIGDLANFARALGNGTFFKRASTSQQMWRRQYNNHPYALGVIVSGSGNNFRIEHGGTHDGSLSLMWVYPRRKSAIVLMSNSRWFKRESLAKAIAKGVLGIP